jgi:hypothetical protein
MNQKPHMHVRMLHARQNPSSRALLINPIMPMTLPAIVLWQSDTPTESRRIAPSSAIRHIISAYLLSSHVSPPPPSHHLRLDYSLNGNPVPTPARKDVAISPKDVTASVGSTV